MIKILIKAIQQDNMYLFQHQNTGQKLIIFLYQRHKFYDPKINNSINFHKTNEMK